MIPPEPDTVIVRVWFATGTGAGVNHPSDEPPPELDHPPELDPPPDDPPP